MAYRRRKKKIKKCRLCEMKLDYVDYKDTRLLSEFLTDKGKIIPKRLTGNCSKHQRMVKVAIKRARQMGLLPYLKI
ncbi:30S ribosomal protein S18 [Thermotoga maritima MSB8]|jgi:small subunit ribosomal protein S18|uniref:Small ribosomal subunit protein bS18 n=1 Tax=Thermotoga maritima (strain ATCC 43589 / DSM 3109 / JCM 10099 / NBRC 100826 / MSB8) TaxID=243274 RepID=RS18_THEMA|nr:30S ribosomal protein S18 [Thermotoga maritima]Q9WZ74.1 RecName: Full=Small ribosomal subunit protein bS18; AltName: Full=30S ribosomal protein S18 [Thermotoga maritima MSB8]AAD35690.1 ribosomal protein S18 [Thermotoga maritima MSB8]AGL49530.1 SSU ribosomal protein S18p [Thermotoga maritima MSB8]AHD17639.1 30S ribosomal protein S18 [Thermotoga maritima MSB8]AKE26528.1 30S ribosomal protein S18 [Thermotoga maritima]AKE28393.1 30S ribosomal protein S18 [Thermotoga maritima MSB8]